MFFNCRIFVCFLAALVLAVSPVAAFSAQVLRVNDGDTLILATGQKVRLVQIDTPELSSSECYAEEARKALIDLISKSSITLEPESVSGNKDQFGRLLRYVKVGNLNVNLKLVELGAATPYFYNGEKGRYAHVLLNAARKAKAQRIGLWKFCPFTILDPSRPVDTRSASPRYESSLKASTNSRCDPNYAGCIPPYPPNLDCVDIKRMGLTPIFVKAKDVHKFDFDGDGVGCDN